MRRRALTALLCALACAAPLRAAQECRQALALGLDVSGSVDAREYRLQIDGLASALDRSDVRGALLTLPAAPVELLVYEWSGPSDHALIVPWTRMQSDADIDALIAVLRATERRDASPGTALGVAMQTGEAYLAQRAECWKRTLDISGDGKSNLGPRPQTVRPQIADRDLTVNALVIGADAPAIGDLRQNEIAELSSYFRANVIFGPDAFVETALGYEEYADAMARKLLRELETITLSGTPYALPDGTRRSRP